MSLELSRAQRVVVTIGVLMGMLLASLDSTIVGTALPRIAAELNGRPRQTLGFKTPSQALTMLLP